MSCARQLDQKILLRMKSETDHTLEGVQMLSHCIYTWEKMFQKAGSQSTESEKSLVLPNSAFGMTKM